MDVESKARGRAELSGLWRRIKALPAMLYMQVKEVGKDDPRRIIHSLKDALALTLVSSFYYCNPLYDSFEKSGIRAVVTVIVLMEFTVGATLSKGVNRGLGTVLAGGLGVGVEYLASLSGDRGEQILLGFFVFLLAAVATFARFFPGIKAKYDYAVVIFILTFSMVVLSGYHADGMWNMVYDRILTVFIGGAICLLVNIFVCPVWAGETLHNTVVSNLNKLASYREGFGSEFFGCPGDEVEKQNDNKSFLQNFKTVLHSKNLEESLENYAKWEPRHGNFRFRHPWKQYLKIGESTRQCAYQIQALDGFLSSQIQVPREFKRIIKKPCTEISLETGKALKELASTVETMTYSYTAASSHLENAKCSIMDLKNSLKAVSFDKTELLDIIPAASMASILVKITKCVEEISILVQELSRHACFATQEQNVLSAKPRLFHRGIPIKPLLDTEVSAHIVIEVVETKRKQLSENENAESPKPGHVLR